MLKSRAFIRKHGFCSLKQGCRIKADQELEKKARIPVSYVFVVWWYLCVLGRTDLKSVIRRKDANN